MRFNGRAVFSTKEDFSMLGWFSEPWQNMLAAWGIIIGGVALLPILLLLLFGAVFS